MADRKVFVEVKVGLTIRMDEGVSVDEVIQEMDYNFKSSPSIEADIENTEIKDFEVIDSK